MTTFSWLSPHRKCSLLLLPRLGGKPTHLTPAAALTSLICAHANCFLAAQWPWILSGQRSMDPARRGPVVCPLQAADVTENNVASGKKENEARLDGSIQSVTRRWRDGLKSALWDMEALPFARMRNLCINLRFTFLHSGVGIVEDKTGQHSSHIPTADSCGCLPQYKHTSQESPQRPWRPGNLHAVKGS